MNKAFSTKCAIIGIIFAHFCSVVIAIAAPPKITVIYPQKNANLTAVESTFIFGSVPPKTHLTINGINVPVHAEGGFIAFLPINPGHFEFRLQAMLGRDTSRLDWPVNVPQAEKDLGYDSLYIIKTPDSDEDKILAEGDMLTVGFRGTPGCLGYFSIPGLIDSMPMAELSPQAQPYWGESLFGVGAIPDSLKLRGYFQGFLTVGSRILPNSTRVVYHLIAPSLNRLMMNLHGIDSNMTGSDALSLMKLCGKSRIDSSGYSIKVNPPDFPRMVEFIDSIQIIRVGPRRGYLSIFQPQGVMALAVGRDGDWLKLKLSETQFGWIQGKSVRFLDMGYPPIISYLKTIRTYSKPDNAMMEFPLSGKHPFQVEERDGKTVILNIFGVNSDTDWIRYDFKSDDFDIVTWSQPEPELYQITVKLKFPIWGYDVYYEGNILKFIIKKPPQHINELKDKIIVIDPGHSIDPGAVGPTGLKESEANLNIALALQKELAKRGAKAILTRRDMSDLPLNNRPAIAKKNNADLFISIHNNALPDGVNPFVNNGVSTYYYHPHSIELAKEIQRELIKNIGLGNYGLYYGNLAVDRPTQYPAVLVECAFIILPEQEALLKTGQFQNKLASSIRRGIEKFLREYER